ncbi:MAG TPA: glycosyltransferase family 1 protein [Candidatus Sulfomarinibacteraceae bacterium]|nr:glycosyltransferase family 1 protein [Candidatus Sulfomarinibacteraceae bacterium]
MLIGIDASRATRTQRTGTEAYAYHLLRELIPLAEKRGRQIRLYFESQPPPDFLPRGSRAESVIMPWPRLWTHIRLGWELRQRPPDLFFTPAHVIPVTYDGAAAATIHDLGYRYFPEAHTRFQVAYLNWSTRHNARRSRRVLADSQATRDDLARLYGTPLEKITVVYPGVDPDLQPVREETALAAALDHYAIERPYFLYLGTLQPRKNLVRLLDAFADSGAPQQLVLAGKPGWLAQPILSHIETLPPAVASRVRLTGYVAAEDKAALLSGATALLFPSLYEGFGFPVLEAQACATAVLCADNSSLPEVAGDAALLVDARDTAAIAGGIRRLAEDGTLRQELVTAGLDNVQRFTWKNAAREALAALESAADGAKVADT